MKILFLNPSKLHRSYFPQAQCIQNLENVLIAAGASLEKVVKVNVYLKDMDNFSDMNEVYEKVRMEKPPSKKVTISALKTVNPISETR